MSANDRIARLEQVVAGLQARRNEIITVLMWEICKSAVDAAAEFDRTMLFIGATIAAYRKLDREEGGWNTISGIFARVRRAAIGTVRTASVRTVQHVRCFLQYTTAPSSLLLFCSRTVMISSLTLLHCMPLFLLIFFSSGGCMDGLPTFLRHHALLGSLQLSFQRDLRHSHPRPTRGQCRHHEGVIIIIIIAIIIDIIITVIIIIIIVIFRTIIISNIVIYITITIIIIIIIIVAIIIIISITSIITIIVIIMKVPNLGGLAHLLTMEVYKECLPAGD
jgi:hypothetical protein